MNENINHKFFIWDEKNSTELQKSYENKKELETKDITNDIQMNVENLHWKDITDPKLRRKMRNRSKGKSYYKANKEKINKKKKIYRELNREKIKLQRQTSYIRNKEKIKKYYDSWYEANKEKVLIYQKKYQEINKNKRKLYYKLYRKTNKNKLKELSKVYREVNKDKLKKYIRSYDKKRTSVDIQYKLSKNLRSRLNCAIKKNTKSGSAVRDLGCSIEEFKAYLESKFLPGMTWDNWSRDGWHIDHIKPLASFDLTDRKQLLEACHYTNLQPLWAKDNISKSDNIV